MGFKHTVDVAGTEKAATTCTKNTAAVDKCPKGQGFKPGPTIAHCEFCPAGKFSAEDAATGCKDYTKHKCAAGNKFVAGSEQVDNTCVPCTGDTYNDADDTSTKCLDQPKCTFGQKETTAGTLKVK